MPFPVLADYTKLELLDLVAGGVLSTNGYRAEIDRRAGRRKHMFRAKAVNGTLHFRCEKPGCGRYVIITRDALRKILVEGDEVLTKQKFGDWQICRG